VFGWIDIVDDLSGLERTVRRGRRATCLRDRLGELFGEIGRTYAPFLVANAPALARGAHEVKLSIDGEAWTQEPFAYQGKCVE
jgi:hypothetical protein